MDGGGGEENYPFVLPRSAPFKSFQSPQMMFLNPKHNKNLSEINFTVSKTGAMDYRVSHGNHEETIFPLLRRLFIGLSTIWLRTETFCYFPSTCILTGTIEVDSKKSAVKKSRNLLGTFR